MKKDKEEGEVSMTEPVGYCAMYVAIRFVDGCVHKEDQHHCGQADRLDIQEGRVHAIPTIPKNTQTTANAPREELRATHEVKCHPVIPAKDVMPLLTPGQSTHVAAMQNDKGREDA